MGSNCRRVGLIYTFPATVLSGDQIIGKRVKPRCTLPLELTCWLVEETKMVVLSILSTALKSQSVAEAARTRLTAGPLELLRCFVALL
jgi:hypothetical protein